MSLSHQLTFENCQLPIKEGLSLTFRIGTVHKLRIKITIPTYLLAKLSKVRISTCCSYNNCNTKQIEIYLSRSMSSFSLL